MKLMPLARAVLLKLGIQLGEALHPDLEAYVAGHAVVVVNGRINVRRFLVSNPGGMQ